MRLDDIAVVTLDQLKTLARMAPKEEKEPAQGIGQGKKSRPGGSQKADLGRLDVGAYLKHYGVRYTKKTPPGKILYCFAECLFDPSHKNEAWIRQYDDGLLTYNCFHNSCDGRDFKDARAAISGADSLAPFCENYDPKYVKKNSIRKAITMVMRPRPIWFRMKISARDIIPPPWPIIWKSTFRRSSAREKIMEI